MKKKVIVGITIITILFVLLYNIKLDRTLKLNHMVDIYSYEDDSIINEKDLNIEVSENIKDVLIKYIEDNFNIDIDDKWYYSLTYHDEGETEGTIQFIYMIGEVRTNKSFTFGFNDNIINILFYKCLEYETDEENLLNRVKYFKDNYKQEKIKLKSGEKYLRENTDYIYFYNNDKLVYAYVVFFEEKDGMINNDNATSYLIDKNGKIVK